ncbi:MAG TPA: NBR1-Ig-like domain-containing protein [Anaerolineales bacterium]
MRASPKKSSSFLGLFGLLALIASSCVLPIQPRAAPNPSQETPFRPPTLMPTATATLEATSTESSSQSASQQGACTDGLTFIRDATIPDGTIVASSSRIDKRWEVENSGTCNWNGKYRLKLMDGIAMGIKPEQASLSAKAGSRSTIRLVFTAPKEPGTYRSAWLAYSPAGQPFGDAIYIEIVVQESSPTPTP